MLLKTKKTFFSWMFCKDVDLFITNLRMWFHQLGVFLNEMIVHLDVFCLCMENKVINKRDVNWIWITFHLKNPDFLIKFCNHMDSFIPSIIIQHIQLLLMKVSLFIVTSLIKWWYGWSTKLEYIYNYWSCSIMISKLIYIYTIF